MAIKLIVFNAATKPIAFAVFHIAFKTRSSSERQFTQIDLNLPSRIVQGRYSNSECMFPLPVTLPFVPVL
jgi:hypothetical protein